MSFVSLNFAVFAAVLVLIYYLFPLRYRYLVLLFASWFFYFLTCGKYIVYILVTTVSTYAASALMGELRNKSEALIRSEEVRADRARKKEIKADLKKRLRAVMICCLLVNFGILAVLKYSKFFFSNLNHIGEIVFGITDLPGFGGFVLPLGISFYTLQATGYIIDLYYMKYYPEKNPLKLALFVSFFPQIVQGPISRFNELSDSLFSGNEFKPENIRAGLYMILFGVAKKLIIADRLSEYIKLSVVYYEKINGGYLALTVFLYSIQLYADFSGGINIAIGVARLFGVRLAENFNRPFFSKSVAEYWRRWHITLGTWFRDYVFYPISISKVLMKLGKKIEKISPFFGKRTSLYAATIVVWTATGFWHGPEWRYIVWGLLNGIIMCVSAELEPVYEKINARIGWKADGFRHKSFSVIRTFCIMSLLRIFDLSVRGLAQAKGIFIRIFTDFGMIHLAKLEELGLKREELIVAGIGMLILFIISLLQRKKSIYDRMMNCHEAVRWAVCFAAVTLVIIYGYYGLGYSSGDFIYMQF